MIVRYFLESTQNIEFGGLSDGVLSIDPVHAKGIMVHNHELELETSNVKEYDISVRDKPSSNELLKLFNQTRWANNRDPASVEKLLPQWSSTSGMRLE